VLVRKAYKFKLRFHDGREALPLYRFAGCCRLIWNTALAFQKERLDAGKHILPYEELTGKLVSWKKQYPFLKEVSSQALQQRLKDLDKALREAFDPTNPKQFSKFKKKYKTQETFRYPQGFEVVKNRIFLPKSSDG
jgi:putative transposase